MTTRIWSLMFLLVWIAFSCKEDEGTPAEPKCYLIKSSTTYSHNDVVSLQTYTLYPDGKAKQLTLRTTSADFDNTYNLSYSYGSNGKVSKEEDEYGYVEYTYNTLDKLVSIKRIRNGILFSTVTFEYNSNGQLVKKVHSQDDNGQLRYFGYRTYLYVSATALNATRESYFNAEDVLQYYTEYEYDDREKPASATGLNKSEVAPSVNNVTKSTYHQVAYFSDVMVTNFSYEYNVKGYPTKMIKSSSFVETTTFEYDCH